MEYIRARWIHELSDEPEWFFHELDDERLELRRVEIHSDGVRRCFTRTELDELPALELGSIPTVEEIDAQDEFEAWAISVDQFEAEWTRST